MVKRPPRFAGVAFFIRPLNGTRCCEIRKAPCYRMAGGFSGGVAWRYCGGVNFTRSMPTPFGS